MWKENDYYFKVGAIKSDKGMRTWAGDWDIPVVILQTVCKAGHVNE